MPIIRRTLSVCLSELLFCIALMSLIVSTAQPSPAQNQETSRRLYAPALQGADAADLSLSLVNPTAAAAEVLITARNYDGVLIQNAGITNPVRITLPAAVQTRLRAVDIFGSGLSGQTGWLELATSAPEVKGIFFVQDSAFGFVDAAALMTAPSNRVVFPKISASAPSPARLSLVNTSRDAISGMVSLYDNSGLLAGSRAFGLSAFSGFSGAMSEFMPVPEGFEGYAVVETGPGFGAGPKALVGFETYRNQSDIAAVRALPDTARLRTGYLVHFATRGGYSSTLSIINASNEPQVLEIAAEGLQSNGMTWPPLVVERTLAPNARLEESVDQMFGLTQSALVQGYIRFETITGSEGVLAFLDCSDGAALSAAEAQGDTYSASLFADLVDNASYYTGIALLNPNAQPSEATLDVFDAAGKRTASAVVTLNPQEMKAGLVGEFFQIAQLGGYVRLTAKPPILSLQAFGTRNDSTFLVTVAAQDAADLTPGMISISPSSAADGTNLVDIRLTGSGLLPDSAVNYDGVQIPSKFVDSTLLTITLLGSQLATGVHALQVINPLTGGTSEIAQFTVTREQAPVGRQASANGKKRNHAPSVSAGPDQTIALPAMANLTGKATDDGLPDGSTLVTTWSEVSGPGTVTFGDPAAQSTTASFSAAGVYVLRLTASDGELSSTDDVTITATKSPVPAFTYSPPNPVTGSPVSFDGSSSQCSASPCTYRWTDDADSSLLGTGVTMSFTFQQVGTKFVRLTITDAQAQAASVEHDVVVSSPPSNLPIVSAGADQTITLPASATLSGSASSPTGAPLTTSWSKVTGTGTVTFGNPGALSTTASFSAAAVYVLRLTATDGVLSNSSDVMITVNSAPITDANFYVSTTGNDSNAGSSTSPWRTIQKAANTLSVGQTVNVNAGTYNERVQVTRSGSAGSLITFQAQGTVVMQGFNVSASFIKINGFEITNTPGTSSTDRSRGSGLYLSGSNVEFSNNYIHNSTAAGIFFTSSASNATVSTNRIAFAVECGIYVNGSSNLIVSNDISHTRSVSNSDADGVRFFGSGNTLRQNYIHAIMLSDSPGQSPHIDAFQTWGPATNYVFEQNLIDKDPSQKQGFTIEGITQPVGSIVVRNNVFITRGTGYQSDVNVGDLGLVKNVTIANNTMVAVNGPVEFAIWIFKNMSTAVVKNNAVYDHGNSSEPYIRVDAGASGLDIGFNSISKSDGKPPVGSPYPNDLWMVNAQFVSIASRDFHLQSTSPLIDKGATLSTVTNDMDGVLRPLGVGYDIGAYEKQ